MSACSIITADIAAEINRHHARAGKHAGEAVAHACAAGALLHRVKAQLPHGKWLTWLRQHCDVSVRQAQRYIRVSQGLPLLIKRDTVSHLPPKVPEQSELPTKPGFSAIPDHAMWALHGPKCYVIEQSNVPGYFYVSAIDVPINDDNVIHDYLTKPIRGDYVDAPLKAWGLDDPVSVAWRWCKQDRPLASALGMGAQHG